MQWPGFNLPKHIDAKHNWKLLNLTEAIYCHCSDPLCVLIKPGAYPDVFVCLEVQAKPLLWDFVYSLCQC